jgi:glutamate dehydrogenase
MSTAETFDPSPPHSLLAFGRVLFQRVAREDLARVSTEVLAALTADSYQRYQNRPMGRATVTILHPAALPSVSVVEIVNDNMPFLLDSTLAELSDRGLEPRLVAHPILAVERAADGTLTAIHGEASGGLAGQRESLIHIHVPRLMEAEAAALAAAFDNVFAAIRIAVLDWEPMRRRLAQAIADYQANPPPLPLTEVGEALHFLQWLLAENFTLLGMREYRFPDGDAAADPMDGTGLGMLRDPDMRILRRGRDLVTITPEVRAFLTEPQALIITKANVKSLVHRRVHLDYVGVKLFDAGGGLSGELRIAGLFTASAYTNSVRTIPYLRRKVETVMVRNGLDPESHSGRALTNVLESYPRDELFQLDQDTLNSFATDILALSERPRLRALPRVDRFDRFVSVLVYIPKDRYDSEVRRKVGAYLAGVYQGRLSASYPTYPEGPLARTHFIIGRDGGATPRPPRAEIEAGIAAIVRTWADGLRETVGGAPDSGAALDLTARWAEALSPAYRDTYGPAEALNDLSIIDRLSPATPRLIDFSHRPGDEPERASLKVFCLRKSMPLSERVPLLENLGFIVVSERTFKVAAPGTAKADRVWLHDMTIERKAGGVIDVAALDARLEAALMALLTGHFESDGYNALITEAGLDWREVAVIRTISRYAQQIRTPFSQDYMAATLVSHAGIARLLTALFAARFDPALDAIIRDERIKTIDAALDQALDAVRSLDEDRILRRFRGIIAAIVRTNVYQRDADGNPREVVAFKLASGKIEGLPLPKPLYEIFLSSPRVEGVHLRFGKVARGGIRWSDRPQDFRTEVLGLVKAQQVKNAVIVPVGAKGGFVPKKLPPASDRPAWLAEGTEAYKLFIRTLLTLTDNIVGDRIVPPADTVRHDGDDPYLVVAADKGTATFSDTANALSAEAGHWLGDAFASGGSAGYDHKKMGITARGGWEAVKRHFREMDIDIQSTPFTVAGVGDMSGDVFGNGMLLSRQIRLVAAFDHRDIFLDPNPDAERSYAERERIFALPRSSWTDYDSGLISEGGGVFSRSLKEIPLSEPVRALLGLDRPSATPAEVMHAILKAPVDLLWFGGIGTYIRASSEADGDVGDRANDAIRVTGAEVNARVIGEGANLGCTQFGRIEAARRGIRLNTDAIDNSAGVNSSDVEVNIKIALTPPVSDGRIDLAGRNALLSDMTPDVAGLVLRNNYLQSLALSLAERRGAEDIPYARRLMRALEREGRLDRTVEALPTDMQLSARERAGEGLTRPELAVLLAYAKLAMHDALLATTALDDPYFAGELQRYFPAALRQRYPDSIGLHRLRREIIATQLSNALINRGGPTLVPRVLEGTGADAGRLAMAYAAVRDGFGLLDMNNAIDALDGHVGGAAQLRLYGEVQAFALSILGWFVRNGDFTGGLSGAVQRYREGARALEGHVDAAHPSVAARLQGLQAPGVPAELALRVARLPLLGEAPNIVAVADDLSLEPARVVPAHLALDTHFRIAQIAGAAGALAVPDQYERLALDRAMEDLASAHRRLTGRAAVEADSPAAFLAAIEPMAGPGRRAISEILESGLSVAKTGVVAGILGDIAAA